MPFTEFSEVSIPLELYKKRGAKADLFAEAAPVPPSDWLAEQLKYALSRAKSAPSEMFYREAIISPILYECLRSHPMLDLWNNEFRIQIDAQLSGTPDYVVSALPSPGAAFYRNARPLLAVAVAKQEDFTGGWGQCFAEMIACQQLNNSPETPVWGIVTTGEYWQFGRLIGATFTQHGNTTDLDPPGRLLGVLNYIFAECQTIAEQWAAEGNKDN